MNPGREAAGRRVRLPGVAAQPPLSAGLAILEKQEDDQDPGRGAGRRRRRSRVQTGRASLHLCGKVKTVGPSGRVEADCCLREALWAGLTLPEPPFPSFSETETERGSEMRDKV